ncbi:MAG: hypothetical protein ABR514_12015 [Chthoniobacterales bacterium]
MTPKALLGISTVMLIFAAVFGLLNVARVKGLKTNLTTTAAARDAAEQRRVAQEERLLKRRDASPAPNAAASPNPEAESKAAKAEADLAQVLKEKADLQTKLQASQAEVTSLQNRIQEPTPSVEASSANPGAASAAELQAQLDDTRRQLESAERENAFLSEKLAGGSRLATSERAGTGRLRPTETTTSVQTKRAPAPAAPKGTLGGTVLAVNQAYNFVVLSLGKRQGLQPNTDLVVFRGGTRIGRLRISSVEPATSIGDIISNSLARGVQVQPGDTVVYAGSHF